MQTYAVLHLYSQHAERIYTPDEARAYVETMVQEDIPGFKLLDNDWNHWRQPDADETVLRLYACGSVGRSFLYAESELERYTKVLRSNLHENGALKHKRLRGRGHEPDPAMVAADAAARERLGRDRARPRRAAASGLDNS